MSEYMATETRYGRTERRFDTARFCVDLAKAFDGQYVVPRETADTSYSGEIDLGDFALHVRPNMWQATPKLHVTICDKLRLSYDESHGLPKYPDIHVSPTRPLDAVARDIKRRAIDPAAEILPLHKARKAEIEAQKSDLASYVARAVAELGLKENQNYRPSRTDQTLISNDPYLTIRLQNDGSAQIERMPFVSFVMLRDILAILRRKD